MEKTETAHGFLKNHADTLTIIERKYRSRCDAFKY